MFGFTEEDSEQSVGEFLSNRGMVQEGAFVNFTHNVRVASEVDSTAKRFSLDQERVAQLAQVV